MDIVMYIYMCDCIIYVDVSLKRFVDFCCTLYIIITYFMFNIFQYIETY